MKAFATPFVILLLSCLGSLAQAHTSLHSSQPADQQLLQRSPEEFALVFTGKTRLLERTHRFAGFRVLKAPDVPSVLIELGFLTNRSDEKQLLNSKWRRGVAGAVVNSIDAFFKDGSTAALN